MIRLKPWAETLIWIDYAIIGLISLSAIVG